MKASMYNFATAILLGMIAIFLFTVQAAPMESDDEQSDNVLVGHPDTDGGLSAPWDTINTAALRKLLMELDTEERLGRATRSWPQAEPRGWSLQNIEGRLARPWRADKRQVRFRQCYFNPISCFRK